MQKTKNAQSFAFFMAKKEHGNNNITNCFHVDV